MIKMARCFVPSMLPFFIEDGNVHLMHFSSEWSHPSCIPMQKAFYQSSNKLVVRVGSHLINSLQIPPVSWLFFFALNDM